MTPLRQHGRLGDQAHFQDLRQNAWLPKPKGEGKGKSEGGKGKGKEHLSDIQDYWKSPLGQIQDPWMHEPSSRYDQWSPDSDLKSILPICALHSPALEFQEHDDWTMFDGGIVARLHRRKESDRPCSRMQ